MTLYVSNMGCHVSSSDLYQLFAAIGDVASARIITDPDTGKSLRYGFVEMTDDASAQEAIKKLKGKIIEGRSLSVVVSKPGNTEAVNVKKDRRILVTPRRRLA